MTEISGGQAVVDALVAHGVDLVFGIPGTHNLEIYRHLTGGAIRHVNPRHEQGGGYAADAYARITGRPGVCVVTTGPGLTNIATAAATAYADSVPMLIISPGLPRGLDELGSGYLHEVKAQSRAMANIVAMSIRVNDVGEIAGAIDDAFALFSHSRPRPVHIEVPIDVLEGRSAPGAPRVRDAGSRGVEQERIAEAAGLLLNATSPALILGGGARAAVGPARELAEHLDAPVVTTVGGKGIVDERHRLSLGASIRLPSAQRFLGQCDVVLAVGTELADSDLWGGTLDLSGTLIRADIDAGQLNRNARADVALLGDATASLGALVAEVRRRGAVTTAQHHLVDLKAEIHRDAMADGEPFAALHAALAEALDPDAIVAGDSARACYFGAVHLLAMATPSFVYPTGYATLGYALPGAIGAKLACPQRQVLALSGDGGFMFTLQELASAVEMKLPIPIVIINDAGYGQIRAEMELRAITPLGVDFPSPDFAALARAFGAEAVTLRGTADLARHVTKAFSAAVPTVIDVTL